jgi:RND family efflux transporter MFP subunit
MRRVLCLALLAAAVASAAPAAEITVAPETVTDAKAVYGQVLGRDVIPARARIGGTVAALSVEEGSEVRRGQPVATVVDDKLALQLGAVDARLAALESERANAADELARAETLLARGVATRQQTDALRTRLDVVMGQIAAARADRAVIEQQAAEGVVAAPADGRVLTVPVTLGSVILPGEPVATIAGGGFFLRLALPERHAGLLALGQEIALLGRPGEGPEAARAGRIVKLYPELEAGHVVADVEAEGLDRYYVGERTLVRVPVAERTAIRIPAAAVSTRGGVDFVTLATPDGPRAAAVIVSAPDAGDPPLVEALSGLRAGDVVVVP